MKRTILTFCLLAGSLGAFAQGKVSLQMDMPLTLGPPFEILAADIALSGQAVPTTGPLLSGVSIAVGLYAGTSSAHLSLVSSTVLNPAGGTGQAPGIIPITHMILPFAGGALAYFQVKIWDSAYPSLEAQWSAGHALDDYSNWNHIFTMTAGTSITYVPINSGGNTTWTAVGNEDANSLLVIVQMPEPATLALLVLGAAVLVTRRRRKAPGQRGLGE
jgi:hypothetical protein